MECFVVYFCRLAAGLLLLDDEPAPPTPSALVDDELPLLLFNKSTSSCFVSVFLTYLSPITPAEAHYSQVAECYGGSGSRSWQLPRSQRVAPTCRRTL